MTLQDVTHHGPRRKARKLVDGSSNPTGELRQLSDIVNPVELVSLIQAQIDEGWAVTIGRTREGGAIAWSFLQGGKPIKRYTASTDDVDALIRELGGE